MATILILTSQVVNHAHYTIKSLIINSDIKAKMCTGMFI